MPALTFHLPLLVFLLLTALPAPARQGASGASGASPVVIDICRELKRPPAVCQCSATKMQANVNQAAFDHYQAVGATYLQLKREGKRRRTAWSMAVTERATVTGEPLDQLTEKMALAADDHHLAIQACGQQ